MCLGAIGAKLDSWRDFLDPEERSEATRLEAVIAFTDGTRQDFADRLRLLRERAKHRARRKTRPKSKGQARTPVTLPPTSATTRVRLFEEIADFFAGGEGAYPRPQLDLLADDVQIRFPHIRLHLSLDIEAAVAGRLAVVGGWIDDGRALSALDAHETGVLLSVAPNSLKEEIVALWRASILGPAPRHG